MAHEIGSIPELIERLSRGPDLEGLVEYGSARSTDRTIEGDYDLLVVRSVETGPIESLHLFVGSVPVDVNVRSLGYLRGADRLTGFERAFVRGRVLLDVGGHVGPELDRLAQSGMAEDRTPAAAAIAGMRHGHRHALDKVRRRLHSAPVLADFLLHANILWLVQSYFAARGIAYPGEKAALGHLQSADPEIYHLIENFYAAEAREEKLRLSEALTSLVLAPVGGAWRTDEVLAFPNEGESIRRGAAEELLADLLG